MCEDRAHKEYKGGEEEGAVGCGYKFRAVLKLTQAQVLGSLHYWQLLKAIKFPLSIAFCTPHTFFQKVS